ncbi:MAG: glucoamylase family protein [Casimicrobiaceae bacterium]
MREAGGRARTRAFPPKDGIEEPLLRREVFSSDQMEEHGKTLASSHAVSLEPTTDRLLGRLSSNEAVLLETCSLLTDAVNAGQTVTPAGEWLLDNFYLIEQKIREARRHLPKGYSRALPRLKNGPSAGLPRVYDIALEAISHGDGRVDAESFSRFVAAYQTVTTLTLGELWAIPIMLRLSLLENLRRIAARTAAGRRHRSRANFWADQMREISERDPKNLILVIADMARSNPPMASSYVAELARRLQNQSPTLALPLSWMEQQLSEVGVTIEQLVEVETQQQASDQVSVSNSIGSLRLLEAIDWREFVESLSKVEHVLREDPAGAYAKMDFATRDRYRHVVERIARKSGWTEDDVARKAIAMAREHAHTEAERSRAAHVGFYLVDDGSPELERAAGVRRVFYDVLGVEPRQALSLYVGAITALTAMFTAALLAQAEASGEQRWLLALAGIAALLASSMISISIVNWLTTLLVRPYLLPRMDFTRGIPPGSRTLVVVPSLLINSADLQSLLEALEVRFLANRDDRLHFALLTDFTDAPSETLPEDEPLLRLAAQGIEALNEKYPEARGAAFFLFHRPRRWNSHDCVWMGYERKRGKLGELNALLRDGSPHRFALVVGRLGALASVKYVITLDTDTQLPRESARELVSVMAHPLNRPWHDPVTQIVCEGYGILQPRMATTLPGINRSRYAQVWGGEPGVDPYTRAVSDVYQDAFGEGSFIGKGIYDIDAFERSLSGRFPENRILSHDLLEGCHARAGLVSDVELYEDYPARFMADVDRRHRWIRGDWQLARWLLPSVPASGAGRQKNPLSALSRWKIFDNLRRSLTPAALTVLLFLGWTVLAPAWLWTLIVVVILITPTLLATAIELVGSSTQVPLTQHVAAIARSALRGLVQAGLTLTWLPFETYFSLDAILRTTWRLLFTHRRLLEWKASSEAARTGGDDLPSLWRAMWAAPATAVVAFAGIVAFAPESLPVALPVLALWLLSPVIAWWVSRPLLLRAVDITSAQTLFMRTLARKTWAFFEMFVGPKDNWLPPDNYQEHPTAAIAHRTSPTNMGIALLANLAAYDFGYIPAGQLIERTERALDTMAALKRYRGHFYNWYDTQTLEPLLPNYVSSVDSGNLAAHALTLRAGLLAVANDPIASRRLLEGLSDTWRVLKDSADPAALPEIEEFGDELARALAMRPASLADIRRCLTRLTTRASILAASFPEITESDARWWADALTRQCTDAQNELTMLAPWLSLTEALAAPADIVVISTAPTLRELAKVDAGSPSAVAHASGSPATAQAAWLTTVAPLVREGSLRARQRLAHLSRLAERLNELAQMEYEFLYDKSRHLLAIGYNVGERRRDASYYDLLASEARLTTFVAIAQGRLPQEAWFALSRLLIGGPGEPSLVSWSGSMFEYLMPLLVMPTYEDTLLHSTCRAAVARQIEYGRYRGVPWGISESGYNTVDVRLNYQYRAFGVPGLGLKRGLADDLVIAPYASALALLVAPEDSCRNLERLAADGYLGRFGFYEAIDFTPSRLPRGQSSAVVRSFMAHHQGMTFLALASLLLDGRMQQRFASDPAFAATTLLLQERVPRAAAFIAHTAPLSDLRSMSGESSMPVRVITTPDTPKPEVQLLSNGRYHVAVTNAGGGYSRWKDIDVTRWTEDTTRDHRGTFCYLRDVETLEFWSAAFQPTRKPGGNFEAIFTEARAEFRRRDHEFASHLEIVVSPEDDIELRRLHITNRARTRRAIELTSYAEVVLGPSAADALHPAFANLFVQTEIVARTQAILCTRRPRSKTERTPWMFHRMAIHDATADAISYETDRGAFIGRGNTLGDAHALRSSALSNSQGSVLDPIVAIRTRITLEPEQTATVDMVFGVAATRDECLTLTEKYQDRRLADRVFDLAWTHSQVVLRQINATEADAQLFGRLASSVLFANPSLRADASILVKNRRGQSGLWAHAISGDLPIVLLRVEDPANIDLVRQLVQAHAYWRLKGLGVDLVIWIEEFAGYRQLLHDRIMGLISARVETHVMDRPGGIFVQHAEQLTNEDRVLFQAVARVVLSDSRGSLAEQIGTRRPKEPALPRFEATRTQRPEAATATETLKRDLIVDNGLGGFTPDGKEYVITTGRGYTTPAPWANVLANPQFGTIVSESSLGYTWSENAHEFRLTPWHNDPVGDPSGEALYIRDEETGYYWSPTPLPCRGATPYTVRHGFGYSVFEHAEHGIRTELWVYVALDAPIKFWALRVRNESGRERRLSVTGYVEWVLGDLRPKSTMHIVTEIDTNCGALFARNSYNAEFSDRIAFFHTDDGNARSVSGDRGEFIGRNGTLKNPAALSRARLSGKVGAAMDPCGTLQVAFNLAEKEERQIVFRLGVGRSADDAANLVQRFGKPNGARAALATVRQYWTQTLSAVQITTPDRTLDVLANGWLVYQTQACRLWARSGYYQSGGAFGFRDQLQDVMALIYAEPGLVRDHLLLAASRQFPEGDVQHWWHPPTGRGVRTHCSDDFLWLPLAVSRYVLATGDTGVLHEPVHFVEGRAVGAEEDSYYDLPFQSGDAASLYQHCVRAILRGLRFGAHGLPLMGSGDWNDGMNLVGFRGTGESVWLAFFLHSVLMRFAQVARLHDDSAFADRCTSEAEQLRLNVERHGWDGEWYRRAYFDDGLPLGSSSNPECQIDAVAQSWSVLSGAANPVRSRAAMDAVSERLVRRRDRLVQLLDPPFDKSNLDPGYIKGYVPGVRENGGQYTHGAIWAAMAYAALGDGERAWELTKMILPTSHGGSPKQVQTYKVEPYVVAADVYAVPPHVGRGGWTWYTGSAGWMYRLIIESLLGLSLDVDELRFAPHFPADWKAFTVDYRYRATSYRIKVLRITSGDSETRVTVDGVLQPGAALRLIDDGREHQVEIALGAPATVELALESAEPGD